MRLTTRQTCVDGKGSHGRKQVVRRHSKVKDTAMLIKRDRWGFVPEPKLWAVFQDLRGE